MKSKSQVHRFCDLYMLNATPKNPVPTDKILRSLNNKLVAWGAEEQDLIKAIFTCLHWYLTYFYNLFYFHIYFCVWRIINFRSICRGGEPRVIGMVDTRWIETVQIIVLFCLLGISIAMLGPSLPDLGKKFEMNHWFRWSWSTRFSLELREITWNVPKSLWMRYL